MQLNNIKAFKTMPNIHSSDIEWINWYKYVRTKYGASFATTFFLQVWAKQGMPEANTADLRAVLREDGISINENIFNQAADIGNSFSNSIENFLHTGKIITYSALGAVGLITLLFLYNIAKNPGEAVGTAVKYAK